MRRTQQIHSSAHPFSRGAGSRHMGLALTSSFFPNVESQHLNVTDFLANLLFVRDMQATHAQTNANAQMHIPLLEWTSPGHVDKCVHQLQPMPVPVRNFDMKVWE